MTDICKSYNSRKLVCKSGFVQKPLCHGMGHCFTCGHYDQEYTPACFGKELPDHLFQLWESH